MPPPTAHLAVSSLPLQGPPANRDAPQDTIPSGTYTVEPKAVELQDDQEPPAVISATAATTTAANATVAATSDPAARQDAPELQEQVSDLEAAVAAALGLGLGGTVSPPPTAVAAPLPLPRAGSWPASAATTGSPRSACRTASAASLSLELQIAQELGDLAPGASSTVLPPAAPLPLRATSSSDSSSPWRSTASLSSEAEAEKRYSMCGSVSPALETIRESQSCSSQPEAEASGAAPASYTGPAAPSTVPPGDGPDTRLELSCEEEVAALLAGGGGSAAHATCSGGGATEPLADLLALMGGSPGTGPATFDGSGATDDCFESNVGAAVARLLRGYNSRTSEPARLAAPAPAPDATVGRLASLSSDGEEEEEEQEASRPSPEHWTAKPVPGWGDQRGCSAKDSSAGSSTLADAPPAAPPVAPISKAASLPSAAWVSPPGWGSNSGEAEDSNPLANMYARGVRQRQQAEKTRARLRRQQEADELLACTFRPALLAGRGGSLSRPGSAPMLARSGSGGGSQVYERQRAQRQRALERQAWLRHQQEQESLACCTFKPAVDLHSARMFAEGVRYGSGRMVVCGPAASGSTALDESVRKQLHLLHSAGLNAAAAAAMMSAQSRLDSSRRMDGEPTGDATGMLADSEDAWLSCQSGAIAGAALPQAVSPPAAVAPPSAPAQHPGPPLSGASPSAVSLSASPLKASIRLYAHSRELHERQRQAQLLQTQVSAGYTRGSVGSVGLAGCRCARCGKQQPVELPYPPSSLPCAPSPPHGAEAARRGAGRSPQGPALPSGTAHQPAQPPALPPLSAHLTPRQRPAAYLLSGGGGGSAGAQQYSEDGCLLAAVGAGGGG